MSERESNDFMSVESFSQLPFIRPTPGRDKTASSSTGGIRLFGIEVPHGPDAEQEDNTATNDSSNGGNANGGGGGGGESGRKFECHYCCRNFPTSQALGGHQNAHKRERQHAKRAHLQSAMAAHHRQSAAIADSHQMYGILNYGHHRFGSLAPTARLAFDPSPAPSHYHSWNSASAGSSGAGAARFYGGLGSVSQPITGSPLPGLWRVPPAAAVHGGAGTAMMHRDRVMPLPLFGGRESVEFIGSNHDLVASSSSSTSTSSLSSSPSLQNRFMCESRSSVKEDVSLDLHL